MRLFKRMQHPRLTLLLHLPSSLSSLSFPIIYTVFPVLPWELLIAYCACCSAVWVMCSDKPHPQKKKVMYTPEVLREELYLSLTWFLSHTNLPLLLLLLLYARKVRMSSGSVMYVEHASLIPGATACKEEKLSNLSVLAAVADARPQKFVQSCSQKPWDVFCLHSNELGEQKKKKSGRRCRWKFSYKLSWQFSSFVEAQLQFAYRMFGFARSRHEIMQQQRFTGCRNIWWTTQK